jgi:hypothetical protein
MASTCGSRSIETKRAGTPTALTHELDSMLRIESVKASRVGFAGKR